MNQSETTSAAGGGETVDQVAAAYEARVKAVPEAVRRVAEETWGKTWAHAEMGSLLDFAALAAPTAKGGTEVPAGELPTVSVTALPSASSDYVVVAIEPKGEPVRRMLISKGGADVLAAELSGLLAASPPPPAGAAGGGSGDLGALSAEAVAAAYYNCMIGDPKEFWPHHDSWAGKPEAFKAKVRDRMAKALKIAAASAPTHDLGAQGEPVAWDEPDPEIDRILAMSSEEIHAELVAEGHDPSELLRKQKLGLDGLLRLAADRFRWRTEAGSWRRVAERLEEEKIAVADRAIKAWSKLKPCPEEANESLCCFPSCNCSVDRLSCPAAPRTGSGVSVEEIARAMARHQVHRNQFTWNPREPLSDESVQRAEDAGWKQWEGFASSVLALFAQAPRDGGETQGGTVAEAIAALRAIKAIGLRNRLKAPQLEAAWKNAVVQMEREAEAALSELEEHAHPSNAKDGA